MSGPIPISRSPRRGANALEFALTMPLFAMFICAVMDYGLYFSQRAQTDHALGEACRAGSLVDPRVGDPVEVAEATLEARLNALELDCSNGTSGCDVADIGTAPYRRLSCELTYPFDPVVGLVPTPGRVSSATMARLEWQRSR